MQKDFQSCSKRFWQTAQEGKVARCPHHLWGKESCRPQTQLGDGRNNSRIFSICPTSILEAEAQDLEMCSHITGAEVNDAVKQDCSNSIPVVDESHHTFLWMILGCPDCHASTSLHGKMPLEWETWVVVLLSEKKDQMAYFNYRGNTLHNLSRKVYATVLEKRNHLLVTLKKSNEVFILVMEYWTTSIPLHGCRVAHRTLPKQPR